MIKNKNSELIDGAIVVKGMGFRESILAIALGAILREYVVNNNLGIVSGPDGTIRLATNLLRIPDVAFFSWDRFPNREIPLEPVPDIAPDLAVEILSASDTIAEMERKRQDYFNAGVRLVWMIDRIHRTIEVYTSTLDRTILTEADELIGEPALPGFTISLRDLFAELDRRG